MSDYFFRTDNFNDEVMKEFLDYLARNDLYVMKSRRHTNEKFVLPESPEKREQLLEEITTALNDGFYSNDSCIHYLYELFRRYQEEK